MKEFVDTHSTQAPESDLNVLLVCVPMYYDRGFT